MYKFISSAGISALWAKRADYKFSVVYQDHVGYYRSKSFYYLKEASDFIDALNEESCQFGTWVSAELFDKRRNTLSKYKLGSSTGAYHLSSRDI